MVPVAGFQCQSAIKTDQDRRFNAYLATIQPPRWPISSLNPSIFPAKQAEFFPLAPDNPATDMTFRTENTSLIEKMVITQHRLTAGKAKMAGFLAGHNLKTRGKSGCQLLLLASFYS